MNRSDSYIMDKNYYLQLRNQYHPEKIKLIILAESPPVSGKYFYDETGQVSEPLFSAMMEIMGYEPSDKKDGLTFFQKKGFILADATYRPVNHLKGKSRNTVILNDFEALIDDLNELCGTDDIPLLLVKANICRLLENRLLLNEFKVINDGIVVPFPSTGQQKRFQEKTRQIFRNRRMPCNPTKQRGNAGRIGSQKLLQKVVNHHPELLQRALIGSGALKGAETVTWTSPLETDQYKEYRDQSVIEKIGLKGSITYPLKKFWPLRGPVWDATGITTDGRPLLVEAKAHIPEAASPSSKASPKSLELIQKSLEASRRFYAPKASAGWSGIFYQYANRLAHQYYFRILNNIPSILVFLYFINATEMEGPSSKLEWEGATRLLHAVLGLPKCLEKHDVYHAYIDVNELGKNPNSTTKMHRSSR